MAAPVEPMDAAAEVALAMELARRSENMLVWVVSNLELIQSAVQDARATLVEAAGLLCEDIDATDIIVAHAFAVVPALNDLDLEGTLAASAKLVASVFSEAPVLPGAISAAMDLAASVCALPPPVTGTLQDAWGFLRMVSEDHFFAHYFFTECCLYLGIGEDDERWEVWMNHRGQLLLHRYAALARLDAAIWEAEQAVRVHHFYQVESPHRGERMKEAWKLEEILGAAIHELDAVLEAIVHMFSSIEGEIQIVRNAIDGNAG